jgi:hypothetical protein
MKENEKEVAHGAPNPEYPSLKDDQNPDREKSKRIEMSWPLGFDDWILFEDRDLVIEIRHRRGPEGYSFFKSANFL